jgi:phage shock protein E
MKTLTLVLALSLVSCSKKSEPPPPQPAAAETKAAASAKDPEAAKQLIASGAVVIDVRTADEYGDGHLPNATNIPVQDVPARMSEIDKLVGGDKSKPVVVYCAAGGRAAKAKAALDAAGYTHVVNGGGYDDLH